MTISSGRSKRKPQPAQLTAAKKLRSNLPRRRRNHFSTIVFHQIRKSNTALPVSGPNPASFSLSLSSVCDDVSCYTIAAVAAADRRVTRSYSKKKEEEVEREWTLGGEAEVLESSCVESCSIAGAELRTKQDVTGGGDSVLQKEVVAVPPNSASTIEQSNVKRSEAGDSALVCSESFADEDLFCTSSAFSEFQSESAIDEFDTDFLSDTSLWMDDSGSQFSSGDSIPSPYFILFKEYNQQFVRLRSQSSGEVQSDEFSDEIVRWRFENDDDEQSYQRLRSRERTKALKMHDYVLVYASTTEYGSLIYEQRSRMVKWIVETSAKKALHPETTFLAVRLLDRLLSKGFFTNRGNLDILGIACLTLATRIEEMQPYNCVAQKIFCVEESIYRRTEVVAMEWLVQEELKFQCLSPTTYNFLWFYLKAAAADREMESKAEHLAKVAMLDHKLLQFWPSSVAAGIVMLVSLSANRDQSYQSVREAHQRTSVDDLQECKRSLEWLVQHT